MKNNKSEFHCFKCEAQWDGDDYPEEHDAHDGYNCPNCNSEDVGEPLN